MTERLCSHYITSCDNLRLVITDFRPTETLTSKVIATWLRLSLWRSGCYKWVQIWQDPPKVTPHLVFRRRIIMKKSVKIDIMKSEYFLFQVHSDQHLFRGHEKACNLSIFYVNFVLGPFYASDSNWQPQEPRITFISASSSCTVRVYRQRIIRL